MMQITNIKDYQKAQKHLDIFIHVVPNRYDIEDWQEHDTYNGILIEKPDLQSALEAMTRILKREGYINDERQQDPESNNRQQDPEGRPAAGPGKGKSCKN